MAVPSRSPQRAPLKALDQSAADQNFRKVKVLHASINGESATYKCFCKQFFQPIVSVTFYQPVAPGSNPKHTIYSFFNLFN